VNSVTTEQFSQLYTQAPLERRRKIRRAYQLWQENPARVDLDWRAVGVLKDGTLIWFWVGSHKAYEALLRSL